MNKKLYHFTTLDSYNKIESDGFIRASSSGKYGPGVYLTDLDPNEHNIEEISKILYTVGAKKNLQAGKLDHHFCLEISELHVKEERQNVYRYVEDYDLCLSRYRVISRGLIQEFGSGLIIAASTVTAGTVLYNLGAALYSHGTDGRMARTQELKTSLQTFLCSTAASSKFIPVVSEDGGSVQVCCSECSSSPVSDVYEGGYLFSSTIDEKQLQEQLWKHEMTHNLKDALAVLTVGCIFSAPVFLAWLWLRLRLRT